MGLFDRVKRIVTGKANDALDDLEDTTSVANQIIRELDEKIEAANNAFSRVQGQLILVEDDLANAEEQVAIWSDAVLKADSKNDTILLNECIEKLQECEASRDEFKVQHEGIKASASTLEAQIDELTKERNKSAQTVRVMETTAKVTDAQEAVADAIANASATNHSSELGKLQRKIQEESATARAKIASQKRETGEDLLSRVNAGGKESTSDVLARLRNKQ